jgi:hypothetical protein
LAQNGLLCQWWWWWWYATGNKTVNITFRHMSQMHVRTSTRLTLALARDAWPASRSGRFACRKIARRTHEQMPGCDTRAGRRSLGPKSNY